MSDLRQLFAASESLTRLRLGLAGGLIAAGLAGCSWTPTRDTGAAAAPATAPAGDGWLSWGEPRGLAPDPARAEITELAHTFLGVPYRWGGRTPAGFDCSGLVQYTFQQAGYQVPRTSRAQYREAVPVELARARPGDLVFFADAGAVSHVGIYLGGDRFIHAPATGQHVKISSIREDYYRQRFAGAGRLLPEQGPF